MKRFMIDVTIIVVLCSLCFYLGYRVCQAHLDPLLKDCEENYEAYKELPNVLETLNVRIMTLQILLKDIERWRLEMLELEQESVPGGPQTREGGE